MKEMLDKMPILSNLMFMYHLGIAGIYMKRFEIQKSEEELRLINGFLCDGYEFADRGILYNLMEFEFLKGYKEKGKELSNKLITIHTTKEKDILLYLYSARIKYLYQLIFIQMKIYKNIRFYLKDNKRILILILELMKRLLMQELFIY